MAVLVWVMVAIALWHFTVIFPDHFWGGIIGAFVVAVAGGLVGGYLLPAPGLPMNNPPGVSETVFAGIGSAVALALRYAYGARTARRAEAYAVPRR
jgi:uncharacterized membrane protein YeaQ/YmgE (transglycosylase-associated protein family)